MHVAVTGANGHLGANVVRQLLAAGHDVQAVIHRNVDALQGLDITMCTASLGDPAGLEAAFANQDAVIHLAARISIQGDPDGAVHATNVAGARSAAKAALAAGVSRFVHMSSIHSYDLANTATVREDSPRAHAKSTAYDHSKFLGEQEVRTVIEQGLDAVFLNPSGVVGPYDFGPSRMGEVLQQLATNRLPAVVRGAFDWVDVRDVAAAAIEALTRGATGENHLLGGHHKSMQDVARAVSAVAGSRVPPALPLWVARMAVPFARGPNPKFTSESLDALAHGRPVDASKAARVLGHAPRSFEQTIADTLRWFEART